MGRAQIVLDRVRAVNLLGIVAPPIRSIVIYIQLRPWHLGFNPRRAQVTERRECICEARVLLFQCFALLVELRAELHTLLRMRSSNVSNPV